MSPQSLTLMILADSEKKCDESKRSCGQCSDRLLGSLQCDYPVAQKPSAELSFPLPAHTVRSEIDNASARDKIVSSLKYSGVCGHFEDPIYRPGDALDLLNHFLETDDPWMGSPSFQQIVQRYGLGFSLKAPYLMHAILAFSACHLDYLYPHEKKYSIAFTLHYSLSLSSYSRQLRKSSDPSNADATIASSYLHTMMAFRNVQSPDHIKFSADSGGLPWLRAMRGVTIMWETSDLRVNLRGSVLLELQRYGHCSRDRSRDVISSMALEIPTEFHKLYEVDCDPDTFKNSYEKPLLLFSELMRVGTSRETICKFSKHKRLTISLILMPNSILQSQVSLMFPICTLFILKCSFDSSLPLIILL